MKKNILLVILMNAATLLFSSWNKLSDLYTQSALKFKASVNSYSNTGNQLAVTHHQLNVNGLHINYTATAGYMPVTDKANKPVAKIFYVAYQSPSQPNTANALLLLFLTADRARHQYGFTWVHLAR